MVPKVGDGSLPRSRREEGATGAGEAGIVVADEELEGSLLPES